MREGTYRGTPTLTPFDPIKEVPGTEAYNANTGSITNVTPRGLTTEGSYTAAPITSPGPFAGITEPSVPRRSYVPTVNLDYLDEDFS